MAKGIGYQAYRKKRMAEGIRPGSIENKEYYRHIIYFGRQHVIDFETEIVSRGFLKVGKSRSPTSLVRQRNEGGGQFRVYGEIVLNDGDDLDRAEKIVHAAIRYHKIYAAERQRELFDLPDSELPSILKQLAEFLESHNIEVKELNLYNNDISEPIPFESNNNLIPKNTDSDSMFMKFFEFV